MTKKLGQIAGGATVIVLTGAIALGAAALFTGGAAAEPAPTQAPALVIPADAPNGLAGEQEAASAAWVAEQARLAAEAEAARVAAEAEAARVAAEAEAARIAAEQAAWEAAQVEEPVYEEPEPEAPYTGPDPNTQSHTICEVLADGTQIPCQ